MHILRLTLYICVCVCVYVCMYVFNNNCYLHFSDHDSENQMLSNLGVVTQ